MQRYIYYALKVILFFYSNLRATFVAVLRLLFYFFKIALKGNQVKIILYTVLILGFKNRN